MSGGVSNSFDYVPVKILDGFVLAPDGCTAASLGLSSSRTSRVVIGKFSKGFALLRTRTSDFTDAEIRYVVHAKGQLYLDVSGKPQIENFASDVVQMPLAGECLACPSLEACCCCYVPADQSRFLQDEAWIRRLFTRMKGRVLDVGMGYMPYRDELQPLVEARAVEYVGVDPDERAVAQVQGLGPAASALQSRIEDARLDLESFDWVVAIRSLNHFSDVDKALTTMFDALRPGGRMLVVESLPLPLVRGRRHSRLSHETAKGGFQHFRNWGSEDFLRFATGRFSFELVYHRPVGRDTCDQWFVLLRKA